MQIGWAEPRKATTRGSVVAAPGRPGHPPGGPPRELVEALGTDLVLARARRTQQWIERDGARWEPLVADVRANAVIAPRAMERAS